MPGNLTVPPPRPVAKQPVQQKPAQPVQKPAQQKPVQPQANPAVQKKSGFIAEFTGKNNIYGAAGVTSSALGIILSLIAFLGIGVPAVLIGILGIAGIILGVIQGKASKNIYGIISIIVGTVVLILAGWLMIGQVFASISA
jgi:hypothetical protein